MVTEVVDREEIELMMWTLSDILNEVREIQSFLWGDDAEETEEADS